MIRLEISAYSLDEAKMEAYKQNVTVLHDITSHWKHSGAPMFDKEMEMCAAEYMHSKGIMEFEGAGIIIQLKPGHEDTRVRPYKIEKFKRGHRCKVKKAVEIRRIDTDEVVGRGETKLDALYKAQELVRELKTDLYGKLVYYATNNDQLFRLTYSPSVRAKLGQYVVFGVDQSDVKIFKQQLRNL